MCNMAKGDVARWLARGICLLMVASLLAVGPSARRAAAQEVSTSFKIVPVAVLDFANKSPYGGDIMGRKAADALVVSLDASGRFDPLQREQVDRGLRELGLGAPLNDSGQQRLGDHLEVAGVISGEVRKVEFLERRGQGLIARVTMGAVMLDVATGHPINGALVAASSSPKPGYSADRDVLVNEALRQGAYEIVNNMISFQAPQVAVSSADASHAYLMGGTRSGLRTGLEMVVLRFGDKVGLIRVTEVDASMATAEIVENLRGITINDKAVGIFRLPSQALPGQVRLERAETSRRFGAGKNAIVGALAAAVLFLTLSGNRSAAFEETRDVVCSSLSDTVNNPYIALLGGAATLTTWQAPARDKIHLIGYFVWREGLPLFFVFPYQGYFAIDPLIYGSESGSDWTLTASIDANTGLLTDQITLEKSGGTTEMPPISYQPSLWGQSLTRTWTVPDPPEPGRSYRYTVSTLTAVQIQGGAGGGGGGGTGGTGDTGGTTEMPPAYAQRANQTTTQYYIAENQALRVAGPATAIVPPTLLSPDSGDSVASLAAVDFSFAATGGADQYVLQVSRNSLFKPADTVSYDITSGFFPDGTVRHRLVTDLATTLPPPAGGGTLQWRVGARNSTDETQPRLTPGLERSIPQDRGWVWSEKNVFLVGGASPAPTGVTVPQPPPSKTARGAFVIGGARRGHH